MGVLDHLSIVRVIVSRRMLWGWVAAVAAAIRPRHAAADAQHVRRARRRVFYRMLGAVGRKHALRRLYDSAAAARRLGQVVTALLGWRRLLLARGDTTPHHATPRHATPRHATPSSHTAEAVAHMHMHTHMHMHVYPGCSIPYASLAGVASVGLALGARRRVRRGAALLARWRARAGRKVWRARTALTHCRGCAFATWERVATGWAVQLANTVTAARRNPTL